MYTIRAAAAELARSEPGHFPPLPLSTADESARMGLGGTMLPHHPDEPLGQPDAPARYTADERRVCPD